MSGSRKKGRERKRGATKKAAMALVALLGLVGAWSGWRFTSKPQPSVASGDTHIEIGALEGQRAPDITLKTLAGNSFALSGHQGKPTILFAMAYWCGTCIPEARALAKLHQEHQGELNIVVIDIDPGSTPESLGQFKAAVGDPDYTWAFDQDQNFTHLYKISSLDTTVIIDAAGIVAYRDNFPTPYENLGQAVSPLLARASRQKTCPS